MTGPEPMDTFAGTTALVVGGAGFVGSNLVRALLASGASRVLVVDNLLSSERDNLPDDAALEFVEASINDASVLSALPDDLDFAFQLATYHGNQSSMANPLADHEHNLLSSLSLFDRLAQGDSMPRVVYAGAGCTVAEKTFDEADATDEDAPVSLYLDSPYQISKVAGELYANYYWQRHGLPVVKARFQNVYGPGEVLGTGRWRGTPHTIWRNVTPTFIYRGLRGMPLTVENGGIATRDFIHVDDIVHGLMRCAVHGEGGGVYNLASGVETSILELAERINVLTDNPAPMDFTPARDWDRSGRRYGSTTRARAELGFECRVGIDDGLAATVAWTRDNLDRIEACMRRHEHHLAADALAR